MTDQSQSPQNIDTKEQEAFAQLDTERVRQAIVPDVERLAEEKAKALVEKARDEWQRDLAKRITGDEESSRPWSGVDSKGRPAPTSHDEIVEVAKKEIRDEYRKDLEKMQEKRQTQQTKQQEDFQKKQQELIYNWDQEVYELQQDGVIPKYTEEVQKKIDNRISLTQEDFEKDAGLRARADLFRTAQEKGTTPYKAWHRYAKKQPAGSRAPVFGGMQGNNYSSGEDDYTYEDVQRLSKMIKDNS